MPHDRAHRPDMSQGGDPSGGGDGVPSTSGTGGGTYFLGRYRVVDEIGIGGMASVHLARMDGPGGFQKWVAIKKIHPHLVEDDSFVQMFLDEARVAARISHPNVATVFDLGKHEDTYWIAMEYLHGEPLREVMRRTEELGTAMPPEIACRVIADAAEGLHAAHELLGKNGEKLQLVHRDVTPHNLFVTYDGVTKVVDFGIAKFSSRMSHTRAGTLKGKLAYMSPEQVHGEGIDRRTDIFALGVVLWELTTGQRLFRMESDLDTLAKVQECNVPRPSTLIRGYPVDLEKIVMKALAKNRGERFRSARELSRALQSLLMRRGLFIASDEVAAYTQSIFNDRIQKRDAHLRWAAEVTQTINVEQLLSKPKIGPEFTSSEVQPQSKPPPVRPAAGAPAMSGPMSGPPARGYAPSAPPVVDELKTTGPSAPTAPRPALGPPRPGQRAPLGAPRPAAGAPPPQLQPRSAPPPPKVPEPEEPHPADGDGPTIQAMPPTADILSLPLDLRRATEADPPTLTERAPTSDVPNDVPTLLASGGARGGNLASAGSDEVMNLTPGEDEDQDETKVANMRPEAHPLQAPPTFPAPGTNRSAPPGGSRSGQTRPPPRFAQTSQMGGPSPISPPMGPPGYPPATAVNNDMALSETIGMGQAPPNLGSINPDLPYDPTRAPRPPMQPQDLFAHAGTHATSPTGDFISRSSPRVMPTMPRVPTFDNRTMTVQRYRRRPPMWVVAALSCSIALLIAGVVNAMVSSTGTPSPPKQGGSSSTTPGSEETPGGGPFTSARTAFNTVITQPTSSASPTVAPPVASPGGATAVNAPTTSAEPAATAATPGVSAGTTSPPSTPAPQPSPQPSSPLAVAPAATPARPATPPQPAPVAVPPASAKATKPAALGAITVVCMPKCDQIVDNGTPLGAGHIFNRPVPAGKHVLQLSAPNGVRKNMVIEVVPDQTREVRMSMDK